MASVSEREPPNFEIPWLSRWRAADFSWSGLAKHPSWVRGQQGSLQDDLRRIARMASDADLIGQGALIDCGSEGLHHVLFIPDEWAASGIAAISPENLTKRKQNHWNLLTTEGGLRDSSYATIAGAQLPSEIEQRLVSGFRVSFEWIRFNRPLRNIPRRGDRSFTYCAFDDRIDFYGRANPEAGECTIHFTWCEFSEIINLEKVSSLDALEINESLIRERIDISESNLSLLRLDYCDAKLLSITDSAVSGPITVGSSKLGTVECINANFDAHVLFVDSEIGNSIQLLSRDFKNRVTFAEVTWPSGSGCASASGSKFDGIVEITGGQPPPVQFFQEAEFRSKVSLNSYSDRAKRESFKRELAAAESQSDSTFNKQKHAQDVESGCRTLRKVAEAAGDVQSEHLWHRAELIARRARGESAATESGFSRLYGMLADYGLSISRPFVILLTSTAIFALIYSWLGGTNWTGSLDWRSLEEGIGYSLNRTIPIGVFGEEHNAWRDHLLGSSGQLRDIGVRALATCQTILSAVLIYLAVMAIRRKFRIS